MGSAENKMDSGRGRGGGEGEGEREYLEEWWLTFLGGWPEALWLWEGRE